MAVAFEINYYFTLRLEATIHFTFYQSFVNVIFITEVCLLFIGDAASVAAGSRHCQAVSS